jgi:GH25 family lysozyme M1 (1,4-beta-N-acetylmuramidase)
MKAGGGTVRNPIFDEQKKNAEQRDIPCVTYHFPDPRRDMREQARKYIDWVGTGQPMYIVDVETPLGGTRPPNKEELRKFIDELEGLTNKQPVIYSRMTILERISFINEAKQFRLWIAQYLYNPENMPSEMVQYRYFHDFTEDHAGRLPPSTQNTAIENNVILWQFSEKGNGPH